MMATYNICSVYTGKLKKDHISSFTLIYGHVIKYQISSYTHVYGQVIKYHISS